MSRRVSTGRKDATRLKIEQMEAERQERRRAMEERKQNRKEEEERQRAAGQTGDVDFFGLVREWREAHADDAQDHHTEELDKLCICVRKRPITEKEINKKDHDSITCLHPLVWVHNAKLKVDGITKYLDHSSFKFDHAFDETITTEQVYLHSTMPLIDFICDGSGGRATVFAYGQTGSGKTYTMEGIQSLAAQDLFMTLRSGQLDLTTENTVVAIAFFEIYGGYIQDLLNDRKKLKVLEDATGEIVVNGLEEFEATDPDQFLELVAAGNRSRTTHSTEANDSSSRSHAICQIMLRDKASGKLRGKMSLVDLAGSERGSDTKSHNSQRRGESAEINTSLLALKECIRALGMNKNGTVHVPYRASKLTLLLKDCFTSRQAKTTMIATVSPGASSADHTINTLRYADRVKEQKVGGSAPKASSGKKSPIKERVKHKSANKASLSSEGGSRPSLVAGNDERALRAAVQAVFEQEEDLLNTHMTNISESAQLLTEEGKLLQYVQREGATEEDIEAYASRLEEIIDRKTELIEQLEMKMQKFRESLKKEEDLSKQVGALPQF